jgi:pimeloyl-ACP methyl ester carboxylesterase
MLAIFQQSLFGSFDAIAPLGYGTIGPIVGFPGDVSGIDPPSYDKVMEMARAGLLDPNPTAPRGRTPAMHRHFYWDDVPEDVIAADDLTVTTRPGVTGLLSIVPYIARDHARRIRCPVFIGLGERDSTSSHHDEPRAYESSSDITFFFLPKSGHCHNSASTRRVLWDRLARWVLSLQETTPV